MNAKELELKLSDALQREDVLKQQLAESQREFRAADATIENLQMQVEKVVAELSAVEAIHNEAVFITDDRYEQCPPEVQKMIRSLAVLQIPAYQAFLAEVRASAVEEFVRMADYSESVADGEVIVTSSSVFAAGHEYADQIRKGVQS